MEKTAEQIKKLENKTHINVKHNNCVVIAQEPTNKAVGSSTRVLSPEKQKLCRLIHEWAYTDPKKNPKKFTRLLDKIWGYWLRERY